MRTKLYPLFLLVYDSTIYISVNIKINCITQRKMKQFKTDV